MSAVDLHRLTSDPTPKALFGFDVIDPLGEGAGSSIYVVSDRATHQIYALKHVIRRTDKDARFIEQLENEFAVSRSFAHPALRKSIDIKLNKTWLGKVTQASQGLEALHAAGYVHCDLKPNNILIGPSGAAKVIDFGQACKAGTVKERIQGTPDFIASEQVKREAVTFRTDVFNFGATMYWAVTGKKIPTLFTLKKDENSFLVHDKIATPRDLNGEVPETLSNLIMECVRTNPLKRPESMGEVTRRLEIIHHSLSRRVSANGGSGVRLAVS